jgi:hypothetical protein
MAGAALLVVALAAPAVAGPSVRPDHWELGPLTVDQKTTLTWPSAYVPSFTLVLDRRRLHRLSLGLDLPALRGLSFDAVVVEPSDDSDIRARTAHLPTEEGRRAYAWMGARLRFPNSRWQLAMGRSWVVGMASAVAGSAVGRPGEWRVHLVRPLR